MVLIEKYIKPTYVDKNGFKTWTNRYGDVLKQEDENGSEIINISIDITENTFNLINIHGADFQFEFEEYLMKKISDNLAQKNIDLNDVDITNCEVVIERRNNIEFNGIRT